MGVLIKKFIKDYENTSDPVVRERYGKFAGIIGIISNVFLCAIKIIVGLVANSISIIADGVNNLADASSSIITLIGFKLASIPEDEEHPYGHARIEYLTGLLVSALILIVGVQLMKSSVGKIINPEPVACGILAIIVMVLAICIKIWQSRFNIKIGKKINSLTLIATGADSRNDVIATSAVLICILISRFTDAPIDGYAGCLVAAFIIWSGITLIRETSSPLLGEAADPVLVNEIAQRALSVPEVLGIHDLMVHDYGPGRIFASIHIEVDAHADIMESHDMIDNIERKLSEELHIHLTAHMDPIKTDDPLLKELKEIIGEALAGIEGVSGMHDLRMVTGPTHTNIIFDAVVSYDCKLKNSEIRAIVSDKVKTVDPTYFVVITFDKEYTKHSKAK